MVSGPAGGDVTIDVEAGVALLSEYLVKARGWESSVSDPKGELTYQYFYLDQSGRQVAIAAAAVG